MFCHFTPVAELPVTLTCGALSIECLCAWAKEPIRMGTISDGDEIIATRENIERTLDLIVYVVCMK